MRAKAPPKLASNRSPREASRTTRVRRILELAAMSTERVAFSSLVRLTFERPGHRYPRPRFDPQLTADSYHPIKNKKGKPTGRFYNGGARCKCGAFQVALPHYMGKRFGWAHALYCPHCDLPGLVDQCVRIDRYARTGEPGRSNEAV